MTIANTPNTDLAKVLAKEVLSGKEREPALAALFDHLIDIGWLDRRLKEVIEFLKLRKDYNGKRLKEEISALNAQIALLSDSNRRLRIENERLLSELVSLRTWQEAPKESPWSIPLPGSRLPHPYTGEPIWYRTVTKGDSNG